ncbi:peptidyl-prolyl cis-trans isomerase NIMA-interacting protein [Raphidocelis subcapitata]|uniref:Peptidyl-prolyl cis-trans isomerase n=1 Tax=Raphidocelis subcapitata TaxID=307507 RepID=A0A2V0NQ36_9CHLO|nr:peptidyl-prolyl cis-trans isomerase NIMA-interacting protein [Raphidocelis subcapitata]|eukprot:GBF89746.1 peptidyl-prolyl cis-trans isomerase NIMA-interacting protein [Raphidocelis subcapitata]
MGKKGGKGGGSSAPAPAAAAGGGAGGGGKGAGSSCSQVKVRHILCEKHSKAMEALQKIQAGERFEQVAAQYSEDAARKGGDLGWKRRGELVPAFAEAAFALGVGEMTRAPVRSEFGYHLILCEDRKA